MTELSRDSKIHTVAAGVDTQDKGSARTNANREAVTVDDVARVTTSFKAEVVGNSPNFTKCVAVFNTTGTDGLPRVQGSNGSPGALTNRFVDHVNVVGINLGASNGQTNDIVSYGVLKNVEVVVIEGETPLLGTTLYAGSSHTICAKSASGYYIDAGSLVSLGTIIKVGSLVRSFAGFFDVYACDMFVNIPDNGAIHIDGVPYKQSQRFRAKEDVGVVAGNIVKFAPGGNPTGSEMFASNWDASSDSTDLIAGVVCNEPIGIYCTVATSGLINLSPSMIGGAAPVGGDIVYADNTTSHLLTTDSTSGTKIGVITNFHLSPSTGDPYVRILLKFI